MTFRVSLASKCMCSIVPITLCPSFSSPLILINFLTTSFLKISISLYQSPRIFHDDLQNCIKRNDKPQFQVKGAFCYRPTYFANVQSFYFNKHFICTMAGLFAAVSRSMVSFCFRSMMMPRYKFRRPIATVSYGTWAKSV